jgi:DNA polymerase-3 subunit epsilon
MNMISTLLHKLMPSSPSGSAVADFRSTWTGTISQETAIADCPFVVFDTELSGLNPRKDSIVSIGAVKMRGGSISATDEFYRLIRPFGEMTRKSIEIHGITPDELEHAEDIKTVLQDFFEFISDAVLVGHFIHIDLRFLNSYLKKQSNSTLRNPAVDTHDLHGWLLENSSEFKKYFHGGSLKTDLFSVAEHYGVPVSMAHNALYDAFITAQLFQRFLHFLEPHGIRTLNDLLDIGRA